MCVIGYTAIFWGERMATIRDVAEMAGLSVATVSRFINNSGYVSKSAQEKIAAAIKTLDFVPNEVARSLYQKTSKLIGLLLPDISNPFFPMLAKGVEDFFSKVGYQVILGNVQEDPEKTNDYFRAFEQNNVAGILSAVENTDRVPVNRPLVVLDRIDATAEYAVYSDDEMGGKLAANAILAGNPKKIVLISGPQEITRARNRMKSAEKVLQAANFPYDILQSLSFMMEDASTTAVELFKKYPDVDSVIAPTDIHAIAIIQEAYDLGLNIPQDVQIIGYDDIPISNLIIPRLSTIQQPAYQVGYQGAEMLYNLIHLQPVPQKKIILPVALVKRETLRKKETQ